MYSNEAEKASQGICCDFDLTITLNKVFNNAQYYRTYMPLGCEGIIQQVTIR